MRIKKKHRGKRSGKEIWVTVGGINEKGRVSFPSKNCIGRIKIKKTKHRQSMDIQTNSEKRIVRRV